VSNVAFRVNFSLLLLSVIESTFNVGYMAFLIKATQSVAGANFMAAIFWGAMTLAEVPTGFLADRWGPKVSLLVSLFLRALAFVLFFLSNNNIYLLWIASAAAGVSVTFLTGVFSMQIKLSQKKYGIELNFSKISAQASKFRYFGMIPGTLLGFSLIRWVGIEYIWIGSVGVSLLMGIYVFFSWEDVRSGVTGHPVRQLKEAVSDAANSPDLAFYLVANAFVLMVTVSHLANWIAVYVPALDQAPLLLTLATISLAALKTLAAWAHERTGWAQKLSLRALVIGGALCMIASSTGLVLVSVLFFLCFIFFFTWLEIEIKGKILSSLPEKHAGLISSFQSLLENGAGFLGFFCVGWLLISHSIASTWLFSGFALLAAAALANIWRIYARRP